jgi:hypothetical protein
MPTNEELHRELPTRVIVSVENGIADAVMDPKVEWNLLDWDNIKSGAETWTAAEIDDLERWGAGLVSPATIARLRKYAAENAETEDGNAS